MVRAEVRVMVAVITAGLSGTSPYEGLAGAICYQEVWNGLKLQGEAASDHIHAAPCSSTYRRRHAGTMAAQDRPISISSSSSSSASSEDGGDSSEGSGSVRTPQEAKNSCEQENENLLEILTMLQGHQAKIFQIRTQLVHRTPGSTLGMKDMRLRSIKRDADKAREVLRQVRRSAIPIVGIFETRTADREAKIKDFRVLCKQVIDQVDDFLHYYDWFKSTSLDASQEL